MNSKRKYRLFSFLSFGMFLTGIHILGMVFSTSDRIFPEAIYLSILLWLVSVFLWVIALFALIKKGGVLPGKTYMETTRLVTSGIYRFVKHPQYLAYILFNLGIIFKIQSAASITLGIIASLFLAIGMKEEDKLLVEKFGETNRK